MKNNLNFFNPREVRMTYNFTRGIPVIVASLMVTSGIHAGQEALDTMPNGCKGVTLCSDRANIDSNGYEFDIGFLYEQFRLTGDDVGYTIAIPGTYNQPAAGAVTVPGNQSTMQYPTWNMKWGVTIGVGYQTPHDDWAVNARFDWIQGSGGVSSSALSGPVDVWQDGMVSATVPFAGLVDNLTINYYNVDGAVTKGVYFSGCFALEPHMGIKATWIQYKDQTTYGSTYNRYMNTNFWGVGPAFGINTIWGLANGLSLTYDINTALMFGYNAMDSRFVDALAQQPGVNGNNQVFAPALRSILGLRYDKDVYCDRQHIFIRAGWDTSIYFNQWNHIVVSNESVVTTYHTSFNNYFGMTGLIVDFGWSF